MIRIDSMPSFRAFGTVLAQPSTPLLPHYKRQETFEAKIIPIHFLWEIRGVEGQAETVPKVLKLGIPSILIMLAHILHLQLDPLTKVHYPHPILPMPTLSIPFTLSPASADSAHADPVYSLVCLLPVPILPMPTLSIRGGDNAPQSTDQAAGEEYVLT